MTQALFLKVVTSALRLALGGVILWLTQRSIVSEGEGELIVNALAAVVVTLGSLAWAYYERWIEARLAATRAALPAGTTEATAKAVIKEGFAASALTGPTETPVLVDRRDGMPI